MSIQAVTEHHETQFEKAQGEKRTEEALLRLATVCAKHVDSIPAAIYPVLETAQIVVIENILKNFKEAIDEHA